MKNLEKVICFFCFAVIITYCVWGLMYVKKHCACNCDDLDIIETAIYPAESEILDIYKIVDITFDEELDHFVIDYVIGEDTVFVTDVTDFCCKYTHNIGCLDGYAVTRFSDGSFKITYDNL